MTCLKRSGHCCWDLCCCHRRLWAQQSRNGKGPSPGVSGKQPSRWHHGWALLRAQTRKSLLLAARHWPCVTGWVADDTFGNHCLTLLN